MSKNTYFKNVKTLDETIISILVNQDKILNVFKANSDEAKKVCITNCEIVDLKSEAYVSQGWIDIHTHAFEKLQPYSDAPDSIGIEQGVTTIMDAGSVGLNSIEEFYKYSKKFKTEIFSLLNLSKKGISNNIAKNSEGELVTSHFFIDELEMSAVLKKYPNFIKGMKVRISQSVSGNNGLNSIKIANKLNEQFNFKTLMHIGSAPPKIEDIFKVINNNFIVTHAFNGKENNPFKSNESINNLKQKVKQGVMLDVGHGTASFNKKTFEKAMKNNILPNVISTDIYKSNRVTGPVYSLALVASKCLSLKMPFKEIIKAITTTPAILFGLSDRININQGMSSALTFFKKEYKEIKVTDSDGEEWTIKEVIKPIFTHTNGGIINVKESNLWSI